jgi:peptidoglycan/xylan/chitin deacetylase (PgdA/CDA1 family)
MLFSFIACAFANAAQDGVSEALAAAKTGNWAAIDLAHRNYPDNAAATTLWQQADAAMPRLGRVSIATWSGGKDAAVSLTFDDGIKSGLVHGAKMVEERGWRATFFLIGNKGSAPQWMAAAAKGHELGNHTSAHLNLPGLPQETVTEQLEACNKWIMTLNGNKPVLSMAYPFCAAGKKESWTRQEARRIFVSSRNGGNQPNPATPAEMDNLASFCTTSKMSSKDVIPVIDKALAIKGWFITMHHAIIDSDGYEPTNKETMEGMLDHIAGKKDKFWVAPEGDVALYIMARKDAVAKTRVEGKALLITLTSSLAPEKAALRPLTCTVGVDPSWKKVNVEGGSAPVEVKEGRVILELPADGKERKVTNNG